MMWRHFAFAFCCFIVAVTASVRRTPAKVKIHQERSTQAELIASVETLGKTHHLKLKRSSMPTVRFQELIVDANGTLTIQEVNENETRSYFEDEEAGAFVFMNDENVLEGMISEHVALHYDDNEHTVSDINDKSSTPFCAVSKGNKMNDHVVKEEERHFQEETRATSYVAEILVVADSRLTNILGQYFYEYIRIYWKMVDRTFRSVDTVSVALRLSSIVTCKSAQCDNLLLDTKYTEHSHYYYTLEKFSKFIAKYKSQLAPFDLAHLMTTRDLYSTSDNGKWVTSVDGAVNKIGRPCVIANGEAENTGVTEDTGLYTGILTTAHEIGHNLGAVHDPEYSSACSWSFGYMMSYERISDATFYFSPCSSQSIARTVNMNYASCLRTIDSSSWLPIPSTVPGLGKSFDTQCKERTSNTNAYAHPNWPDNGRCFLLLCLVTEQGATRIANTIAPALTGTQCSTGGYCKNGRCQASWQ